MTPLLQIEAMNYSDIPNVNALLALPALQSISSTWATEMARACTNTVRSQIAAGVLTDTWTDAEWNQASDAYH